MSFANIHGALVELFQTIGLSIDIQHQDMPYTSAAGTPWVQLTNLPNNPESISSGTTGMNEHSGILQINLFYPPNKGNGASLETADQIAAVFKTGATHTYNGQKIVIISCGQKPGKDSEWQQTIISIHWVSRTQRG